MCNRLREDFTKIPAKGVAWKIFTRPSHGHLALRSLVSAEHYATTKSGWVHWNSYDDKLGFCAFESIAETGKAVRQWVKVVRGTRRSHFIIKKIEYKNGLGSHLETGFVHGVNMRTIIVRSFKVLGG